MGEKWQKKGNLICTFNQRILKLKIMNNDQLEGKWKQIKGSFKQKYGDLTDDDTTYTEGKFDELLGRLQEKTGRGKEELKREIDNW
ncbi:hypothetical protein GCM10007103_18290 [Salinimicrobium marinum]|uniref:CsbD-like domain-containing protein n=2 Tax=Salinimicrobium marinum TaxID=680283 RepID=A0A918SF51_9FLAO|nr:hypothetical protein GCM10007103_18290 [Salinimicrobium marinum]